MPRRRKPLDLPLPAFNDKPQPTIEKAANLSVEANDYEEGVVLDNKVCFAETGVAVQMLERPSDVILMKKLEDFAPAGPSTAPKQRSPHHQRSLFDDFNKGKFLGRGVFGEVHRVTDKVTGTVYALKSIAVNKDDSIRAELHQLTQLGPNMCGPKRAWFSRSRGKVYLLLEYMCYGSLKDIFEKRGAEPVLPCDVLCVAKSVASALAHLRRKHLLHRDVKPANILVGRGCVVKLADFGISRLTDRENSMAHTAVGTPNYMAPERLNGEAYYYPADIYALGLVVAWVQLGGVHPLSGDWLLCYQPVALPQATPAEIRTLVENCTQAAAAERPTASQLLESEPIATAPDRLSFKDMRPMDKDDVVDEPTAPSNPPAAAPCDTDALSALPVLSHAKLGARQPSTICQTPGSELSAAPSWDYSAEDSWMRNDTVGDDSIAGAEALGKGASGQLHSPLAEGSARIEHVRPQSNGGGTPVDEDEGGSLSFTASGVEVETPAAAAAQPQPALAVVSCSESSENG
ncbi:Mitogen-activated protein kinase kinase 1 [Diplonema papillatum]|nr:Mitogen-activated protein kinase kinase 1 [Diplonema papillatum]